MLGASECKRALAHTHFSIIDGGQALDYSKGCVACSTTAPGSRLPLPIESLLLIGTVTTETTKRLRAVRETADREQRPQPAIKAAVVFLARTFLTDGRGSYQVLDVFGIPFMFHNNPII